MNLGGERQLVLFGSRARAGTANSCFSIADRHLDFGNQGKVCGETARSRLPRMGVPV